MSSRWDGGQRWWVVLALASGMGCADDAGLVPAVESEVGARVELIGVSGRRLVDGDVYRIPLNYVGVAVPPGELEREAFVIRNTTAEPATIYRLAVSSPGPVQGGIELAPEWRVLVPTRAREVPLEIDLFVLPPGGRLDFDIGFRPLAEGDRVGWLELVIAQRGVAEARWITLGGLCARGPPDGGGG